MGGKVSLMQTNTWTRVNRVIVNHPRKDVEQHLELEKTSLLFEDDVHFSTTHLCMTRWTYLLHPDDKKSTETGTGMQAIVGSKEGSVKFFRAKDQKAEGRHVKEGEDPLLDHKGTMTLRTTRRRHEAHAAAVTWVSASEDGAMAATSSMDKTLILWRVAEAERMAVLKGHAEGVTCCEMARDGSIVASGGEDHRVMIWDVDSGARSAVMGGRRRHVEPILKKLSLQEKRQWLAMPRALLHEEPILCVCLPRSAPYKTVASGSRDKTLITWDIEKAKGVVQFKGHEDYVSSCLFSPISGGSSVLISGSYDKTIRLWDTRTGSEAGILTGHKAGVTSVDMTTDLDLGQLLFSGGWDGEIKVWDMFKMEQRNSLLGHYDAVTGLSTIGNGEYVMSVSVDRHVRLWRTRRFQDIQMKILQTLGANMIPLTFPVTYDLDDDIAGCKAGFTRKSTFKDAKGEFVIQDPVFREIPPERQNWVLHKDQRNKKMQNDTTFRELGLIEGDYVEIIKPLTEEAAMAAQRRMSVAAAKKKKEGEKQSRRASSVLMGFAVPPVGYPIDNFK